MCFVVFFKLFSMLYFMSFRCYFFTSISHFQCFLLINWLYPQVFERVPLHMRSQQLGWCTRWPMPAPWENWKHAAVMRSGAGTRRHFDSSSAAYSWRPSREGKGWFTVWWSTTPLSSPDCSQTPGSGVAAALMWNSGKSSQGTSWMPAKPTETSMQEWGCIIIKLGGRWVSA